MLATPTSLLHVPERVSGSAYRITQGMFLNYHNRTPLKGQYKKVVLDVHTHTVDSKSVHKMAGFSMEGSIEMKFDTIFCVHNMSTMFHSLGRTSGDLELLLQRLKSNKRIC